MTEESFDNVSINSEGSSEDISVSPQDEWMMVTPSSKFNILQMTGDKTIVIDKNDVVT